MDASTSKPIPCPSRSYKGDQPRPDYVNEVLLEHSQANSFAYCPYLLFTPPWSAEELLQTLAQPPKSKYLLSGPSQIKFVDPALHNQSLPHTLPGTLVFLLFPKQA